MSLSEGYKPINVLRMLKIGTPMLNKIRGLFNDCDIGKFTYFQLFVFRVISDSIKENEIKIQQLKKIGKIKLQTFLDELTNNDLDFYLHKFLIFKESYGNVSLISKTFTTNDSNELTRYEMINLEPIILEHKKFFFSYNEEFSVNVTDASELLNEYTQKIYSWMRILDFKKDTKWIECFEFFVLRIVSYMIVERAYNISDFKNFDWSFLKDCLIKNDFIGLKSKLLVFDFRMQRCILVRNLVEFQSLNMRGKPINLEEIINTHHDSIKQFGVVTTLPNKQAESQKDNVYPINSFQ